MRSFLKFGALAGGGWLLDCAILLILSQIFGVRHSLANFVSSSTAALLVFSASRFLIFDSSPAQSLLKTFIYFCYTCAVIFAASVVIDSLIGAIKHMGSYFLLEMSSVKVALIAKVLITPPQLLTNFAISRYVSQKKY